MSEVYKNNMDMKQSDSITLLVEESGNQESESKSESESHQIFHDNIKIVVTPINKDKKSASNIDYTEQLERKELGKQMMWDDTRFNKQQNNGIFIFQKNKTMKQNGSVSIHMVKQVLPPSNRLESWSKNVGQQDRNVLYISSSQITLDWNTWMDLGGPKRVQGTQHIEKNKAKIINYINTQKKF